MSNLKTTGNLKRNVTRKANVKTTPKQCKSKTTQTVGSECCFHCKIGFVTPNFKKLTSWQSDYATPQECERNCEHPKFVLSRKLRHSKNVIELPICWAWPTVMVLIRSAVLASCSMPNGGAADTTWSTWMAPLLLPALPPEVTPGGASLRNTSLRVSSGLRGDGGNPHFGCLRNRWARSLHQLGLPSRLLCEHKMHWQVGFPSTTPR